MLPRRRPDLLARVVDGERVILDRAHDRVHRLNATASAIWEVCDGNHTEAEIVAHVRAQFGDAPPELDAHVAAALDQLRAIHLLD